MACKITPPPPLSVKHSTAGLHKEGQGGLHIHYKKEKKKKKVGLKLAHFGLLWGIVMFEQVIKQQFLSFCSIKLPDGVSSSGSINCSEKFSSGRSTLKLTRSTWKSQTAPSTHTTMTSPSAAAAHIEMPKGTHTSSELSASFQIS